MGSATPSPTKSEAKTMALIGALQKSSTKHATAKA
jgi:hypothetical protein